MERWYWRFILRNELSFDYITSLVIAGLLVGAVIVMLQLYRSRIVAGDGLYVATPAPAPAFGSALVLAVDDDDVDDSATIGPDTGIKVKITADDDDRRPLVSADADITEAEDNLSLIASRVHINAHTHTTPRIPSAHALENRVFPVFYVYGACAAPIMRLMDVYSIPQPYMRLQHIATALYLPAVAAFPFIVGFAFARMVRMDADKRMSAAVQLLTLPLLVYLLSELTVWALVGEQVDKALDLNTTIVFTFCNPVTNFLCMVVWPLLAFGLVAYIHVYSKNTQIINKMDSIAPVVTVLAACLVPLDHRTGATLCVLGWTLSLWTTTPYDAVYSTYTRRVVEYSKCLVESVLAYRAGFAVMLGVFVFACVVTLHSQSNYVLFSHVKYAFMNLYTPVMMALVYLQFSHATPFSSPSCVANKDVNR
jgi:hypothetical protein